MSARPPATRDVQSCWRLFVSFGRVGRSARLVAIGAQLYIRTSMTVAAVLVATALTGDCELRRPTDTGTPPALVAVAPKIATLQTDQMLDFTAVAITRPDATATVDVSLIVA